jgi:hypothetical protein
LISSLAVSLEIQQALPVKTMERLDSAESEDEVCSGRFWEWLWLFTTSANAMTGGGGF